LRHKIEVQWKDAKVFVDPTDDFSLPIMTSIGYLIKKDKEKYLLANLLAEDGMPRVVTVIPIALVKKVTKLK
jgi:hypothetical protein